MLLKEINPNKKEIDGLINECSEIKKNYFNYNIKHQKQF